MVGIAATIRWVFVHLPSFMGTLKSTLQKSVVILKIYYLMTTRFPLTSTLAMFNLFKPIMNLGDG